MTQRYLDRVADEIKMLPNVELVTAEAPPSCAPDDSIILDPVFKVRCFKKPDESVMKEVIEKVLKKRGIAKFHLFLAHDSLLDGNGEIWSAPYC